MWIKEIGDSKDVCTLIGVLLAMWALSLFDLLDFAPVEVFLEQNSGRLDVLHEGQHAAADPEEDNGEEDADEGVRVQPLVDVLVGAIDALRSSIDVPRTASLCVNNGGECHHGSNKFLKHFLYNYN